VHTIYVIMEFVWQYTLRGYTNVALNKASKSLAG